MAATIRRSSQNSNVYGAYGIVSSDNDHELYNCLPSAADKPKEKRCDMKPQLNDVEAERMLESGEYIWSDWHKGYVCARRKGRSLADYRRSEPDVISMEELSDNSTDPNALPKERRDVLDWLAERIKQGS